MAARKNAHNSEQGAEFDTPGRVVTDIELQDELEQSYLEYAYSVISSRALPDARDGLKPVHRRILYGMKEMGLRPDGPTVKSARVVGDVLGKYHPHGDSSVYEALVRMSQDFSLNTPFIDGQGNMGSPNDAAAAMRYTECRLAPSSSLMVGELSENTVDFVPNYDGSLSEPGVLPAAFPNLVVNGASGIAVGMATNMVPHNAGEVIAAARALIKSPTISLDKLMTFIPGPDLPTGGVLLGMDQVRAAYETGRGTVRIRGKADVGPLEGSRGRQAITFTELPYQVGTEKIIESIKVEIGKKRLQGIADVKDLSDRKHGTRLVIECKTGVNPQALLADLYRHTPLETSFGINNLALVNGQPRTLGLKELLLTWLVFRFDVVTRRTQFRLDKAEARRHIVEGLLIALDAIDAVVKTIRASKDTAEAKTALMKKFKLTDIQATHILEMPLRRLVSLEVLALRNELKDLETAIAGLRAILDDDEVLKKTVDAELRDAAKQFTQERRTQLLDGDLQEVLAASVPAGPLEVADDPCTVVLSATGLLARTAAATEDTASGRKRSARTRHDVVAGTVPATARGHVVLVTNTGRAFRVDVLSIPALPDHSGVVSVRGGVPAKELVPLLSGERVVALAPASDDLTAGAPGLAVGTRSGVVKICAPDWPTRSDEFTVIGLKDGDEIVGGGWVASGDDELVFVTSDASLLRFPASKVRPQGRSGGGMAGVKLAAGMTAVAFCVVPAAEKTDAMVVTFTGASAKVSRFTDFPAKGRATGGVRAHRFLRDEIEVQHAFVGPRPLAATSTGAPVSLPTTVSKRDASGTNQDAFDVLGCALIR